MDTAAALAPAKLRKDAIRLGVLLALTALLVAFAPSGLRIVGGVLAALGALLCLASSVFALTVVGYARREAFGGLFVYGSGLVAFAFVVGLAFLYS